MARPVRSSPSRHPRRASTGAAHAPRAHSAALLGPFGGRNGWSAVYSDKLNGRKTASGQVFHQSDLTAAHPSLAFGTKVKVTNKNNNKSVEVRINDRGPNQTGRVIDLSSAAAAKIGMKKTSTAPVTLEVVGEAPAKKK